MPIYEYRCKKCAGVFEVRQKFADDPLTVHEDCGGEVERLISAPGLHFKGSGFYVNDYAKPGSKSNGKPDGEKSDSGKKESGDSKPAESKSATTPATDTTKSSTTPSTKNE